MECLCGQYFLLAGMGKWWLEPQTLYGIIMYLGIKDHILSKTKWNMSRSLSLWTLVIYINEMENKKSLLYSSHFYLGFSVTVQSIHMTKKEGKYSEMKALPGVKKYASILCLLMLDYWGPEGHSHLLVKCVMQVLALPRWPCVLGFQFSFPASHFFREHLADSTLFLGR